MVVMYCVRTAVLREGICIGLISVKLSNDKVADQVYRLNSDWCVKRAEVSPDLDKKWNLTRKCVYNESYKKNTEITLRLIILI